MSGLDAVLARSGGESGPPPPAGHILLVEASAGGNEALLELLESRGFRVSCTTLSTLAVPSDRRAAVDVVLLDLSHGPAEARLIHRILNGRSGVIVIVRNADRDYGLSALEAGADDFIGAPHNPRELLARIRALIRFKRRAQAGCDLKLTHGLVLTTAGRVLAHGGPSIALTPLQHRLLKALALRRGEVVARDTLLDLIYGEDGDCGDRAIDVHVSRLRKRLAGLDAAILINSYRGVGYRLMCGLGAAASVAPSIADPVRAGWLAAL